MAGASMRARLPTMVLFTLFPVPAERRLGQLRWLTVGLSAHVLATYISEGVLYFAIEEYQAPELLVHTRDIGVSYFLVGVTAVLAYHVAAPSRAVPLSADPKSHRPAAATRQH